MPHTAKGLYAPRLVDLTFAIMGLGSAVLLANGQALAVPQPGAPSAPLPSGLIMLATVVLIGISACLMHRVDRKGWDDYMGQIVTQSAMIGMVTLLLSAVAIDFLLGPAFDVAPPGSMIQGTVPVAALSWSIGYAFLRWKGTGG